MKKLILVSFITVALLFAGCGNESNNEVSKNTNKVETTAITSTVSNSDVSSKDSKNVEHVALGDINKGKNTKVKYVSSTDKKKINSTSLTEKQMDKLYQQLKDQNKMDNFLTRSTVKNFSEDCGVSKFRKLTDKKKSKCYCKITDDSGRTLYVFFKGGNNDSIWMDFLFLDKNNNQIKDSEINNKSNLLKLVSDVDK